MLELPPGYKYAHVVGKLGHMVRLGDQAGTVVVEGATSKADAIKKAIAHYAVASNPSTSGLAAPAVEAAVLPAVTAPPPLLPAALGCEPA